MPRPNTSDEKVEHCVRLIREAGSIAVLTGAGVSTNAGIPDFRGPQGLYVTRRYDADRIFDLEYFLKEPQPFFDFARDFLGLAEKIVPTVTHRFLADLEKLASFQGIVTQNIDSLHHKAGSKKVYEIHGSFLISHCLQCNQEVSYQQISNQLQTQAVPLCQCGGIIKPDVVFFGENVHDLAASTRLAEESDLFIVIGSSCVVYPAASLPEICPGKVIVVNRDPVVFSQAEVVLTVQEDIDQFFGQVAGKIWE